ncbi:hypothetical protein CMV_009518 [Castanea mollissima]|uniref:Uncharacterized protein n=1 Tax=Castanea mollissima TaxID=60419 RepID=A0A8J4RKX2_9ROSI|nr:hypothetical protein CMV_029939 [Castanea mollissima]KAF3966377.1 hypothetical protein CMV_009518 [Castanea mollissima]
MRIPCFLRNKIGIFGGADVFLDFLVCILGGATKSSAVLASNHVLIASIRFSLGLPSLSCCISLSYALGVFDKESQSLKIVPVAFDKGENKMPLGLILGLGRAFRRKRPSSLDILSSKRAPRDYYKGKNCKPTGFHTRKGGYVVVNEKLPNYVVPDLTDFKLKPYVSQCPREVKTAEATDAAK